MVHLTDRRLPKLPPIDIISVHEGFDLTEFCGQVAAGRGRQIGLLPVFSRPARGGCLPWFEADEIDYVLVEQNTTVVHQQLLALHTVGHLVLGHSGRPVVADEFMAGRMPELDWRRLRPLLGRVWLVAGPAAEAQADAFAVDILARAGRIPVAGGPASAASVRRS